MAATIVKSFFENIKEDMLQELKVARPGQTNTPIESEMSEEERFAAEAEAAAHAAETARRRQEAERRHQQSGWNDGRSRH